MLIVRNMLGQTVCSGNTRGECFQRLYDMVTDKLGHFPEMKITADIVLGVLTYTLEIDTGRYYLEI